MTSVVSIQLPSLLTSHTPPPVHAASGNASTVANDCTDWDAWNNHAQTVACVERVASYSYIAMGGSVVVFDIETQDKIANMPGAERIDQICNLQVSCLSYLVLDAERMTDPEDAAREVEDATMVTLWRDEDPDGEGPFEPLFKAFDEAELICSYNGLDFDHPCLWKHCGKKRSEAHLLKAHDAFSRLRANTNVWFKLDNLLKANGLKTKTANGLEAIRMWNDGERDRLREYCEQAT